MRKTRQFRKVHRLERLLAQNLHYLEEYVRREGTWRIARCRLERLRVDPLA